MTSENHTFDVETIVLHGGQTADPTTKARAVPIYQTTSYVFDSTQHAADLFGLQALGNIYTRIMNPTTDVLEKRIAQLEGGVGALATASGQAAITLALLTFLEAGDEIVASSTLYGGTFHLFAETLPKFGIKTVFVDPSHPDNFRKAIGDKTKAIYAETIGNPKLNVFDVEAVAAVAKEAKIPLVLDATFTTPYISQSFKWGANIVIHSATKWIGGHGTSIGGLIVDGGNFDWAGSGKFPGFTTPDASYGGLVYSKAFGPAAFILKARVQILRDIGASLSPFNSYLLLLGLETLHLRVREHSANAFKVAEFLEKHAGVAWVTYPGLKSHPTHALAVKYFRENTFGGMVIFGIKGGKPAGIKFINSLKLWSHLANVGDAKSLVIHPASTTHQQLSPEDLVKAGVTDDLVRLSVGIESVKDLIADLDQALQQAA